MNRAILCALAALALAACTPDFAPASQVEKLRVLAIRADPPEIAPAPAVGTPVAPDRAALTSFVLRADAPADPPRKTTVLYLACIPVPGDPTPSPCVLLAALRDPAGVLAGVARSSCGGTGSGGPARIAFAGAEVCQARTCGPATTSGGATLPSPQVVLPAGYGFEALAPGALDRILGVQAVVLAFALDATPDELAAGAGDCPAQVAASRLATLWAEREHVLATKRVWIRGPEAPDPPNQNPAIDGIAAGGIALAAAPPSSALPGTVYLTPVLSAGADALHEPYTELDAAGVPLRSTREEWVYSWFSTAGEMKDLHTRDGGVEQWNVGSTGGSPAVVTAVVRDQRGGVAWMARDLMIGP